MSCIVKDADDLADILRNIPFDALMCVAKELVEMNEDKEYDRNVKTPLGMAETLSDWAVAQKDA